MYFNPIEAGKRIKAIREAKGMTQMGFAEKLNISRSYMNKIEKGTKTASIDLLIEIAVYGWVTLDYLILRQSLAAVQVKENIRMMREALNVLEQSLWVCPDSQQDVFWWNVEDQNSKRYNLLAANERKLMNLDNWISHSSGTFLLSMETSATSAVRHDKLS